MIRRSAGELSFEGILGLAFVSLIIATLIAVAQFYSLRNHGSGDSADITQSYNLILTTLREDSQIAATAETASDSVALYNCQNDLISRYLFADRNLVRVDNQGNSHKLLDNIESVRFSTDENLNNLLTVNIMPANRMDIPFFTSFALRGINHDLN